MSLQKCLSCNGALPCYSIEWSQLPENQKCHCKNPGLPPPPFIKFLEWLFKKRPA